MPKFAGPSPNYFVKLLLKCALIVVPVLLTSADVGKSTGAFAVLILVAIAFVWLLHHLEYGERRRDLKQEVLQNYLEQWLRDPDVGFDPDGSLRGRMNIMAPRHWEEVEVFGWRPKLKPVQDGYLAIMARTRSMSRAPDENLRLRTGEGCAGLLWERNEQIAWALIDPDTVEEEHRLTAGQVAATRHLRTVISCAVYAGRGDDRRLVGVLNLDAPTEDAVDVWWDSRRASVLPEVQSRLQTMAEEIAERGYLPM